MWQKEKNTNPIVRLALLLALLTTPMMSGFLKSDYALARTSSETPSFPLPTKVDDGTKIRIDGSASMTRANQALKERFEKEYSGAEVELATNGTDDALKALQSGKIDIAAIGRGLTPEEEQQGLAQQRLRREKIAIIVGKDNPFKGDLNNQLFTKIYRGEITDWSQIGGPAGKIRVIDRPDNSDTREAFRNYPLFKGDLTTGSTATQLDSDDPVEVVKQLGNDGIGFVLANQVSKLENVRILTMRKVLPSDSRYPYSQPLVYVFKKNPSQAVKNFVGFATAVPGKEALEKAREEEAQAVAATVAQAISGDENATAQATATSETTETATAQATATPLSTENATAQATATPLSTENATAGNGNAENASGTGNVGTATNTSDSSSNGGDEKVSYRDSAGVAAEAGDGTIPWWWILLPIAVLGALVFWWLLGRRKSQEDDTVARGVLPDDAPPPFTPTSTSSSGAVPEPMSSQPLEPASTLIQSPVENAVSENTDTQGINAAGIAAGVAGLGLGAAALSSRDKEDTPDISENPVDETSSELQLDAADLRQPDASLNVEAPDISENLVDEISPELQLDAAYLQQPDASLNVETPDISENLVDENSPELQLDAAYLQQPDASLNVETPDLEEPDIPDTSLDLEAPAAVVNNSYPSIPLIPNSTEAAPVNEPVDTTSAQEDVPETEPVDTTSAQEDVPETEPVDTTSAQEELPSASTTNWLGNFAIGSAAAAGAAKIKSQLANKDNSESTVEDNSAQINQAATDENVSQTNQYPQLPDVWETSDTELPATDGVTPNTDLELSNQENQENQTPEITPSDLWGTPQTEQPATDEQENSSFSLGGIAAAGAAGLAGAAALGSKLFERDNNQASEENRESEEQQQVTTPSDLWENPPTEQPTTDELVTQDNADEQQPQVTQETPPVTTSDLPEVRIITPLEQLADTPTTPPQQPVSGDGLPNVWVTPASSQPATPEETVSSEQVAQFGVSSQESDNSTSADAAIAAGAALGAAALGSQLLGKGEESPEQEENQITTEYIALDQIADDAEADNNISTPDVEEIPNESNILLANRTPKWAYASWDISPTDRQAMHERGANQLVLRLYDVTDIDLSYQQGRLVQQYECEETVSHRYVAIPNTEKDYVAEIGYLSADKEWLLVSQSPIVRIFSRPHKDFWFETDAELIIHGATEPGSMVTIDGHNIKVKSDGTFHLRIPFTDALINYLITAVAPDNEQAKTIHMKFSQEERKDS